MLANRAPSTARARTDAALTRIPPEARVRCPRCDLPLATCVCALAVATANRVDVLVLQHPLEAREAKGSARLMRLSLARCRVVVGEVFDESVLRELLDTEDRRSVLLYPRSADEPPPGPIEPAGSPPSRLVVIDGTWRKSLRMLKSNPLLQALPRVALDGVAVSRYGALRKARRATQLGTLEATCLALAALEGDDARYAPLLCAFERFVDDRLARRAGIPESCSTG